METYGGGRRAPEGGVCYGVFGLFGGLACLMSLSTRAPAVWGVAIYACPIVFLEFEDGLSSQLRCADLAPESRSPAQAPEPGIGLIGGVCRGGANRAIGANLLDFRGEVSLLFGTVSSALVRSSCAKGPKGVLSVRGGPTRRNGDGDVDGDAVMTMARAMLCLCLVSCGIELWPVFPIPSLAQRPVSLLIRVTRDPVRFLSYIPGY
ncbi:hypothetical protein EDB81DRAFT_23370 [Dactylonectria macrodidyma]|uniref:Uncharacterized protein n=1 Tax=Dactylonectria macrodidyma TaxID=307937 RepID=A0A9P9JIC5_9HYPO|nr:hypothetical protein EDB81DRAFT_23370 [Dactylonectria macrodidyma]